jgi:hypothetical protein
LGESQEDEMYRLTIILALLVTTTLVVVGCSGGGNVSSPFTPENQPALTGASAILEKSPANTYLWGYYNVFIDINAKAANAVPSRNTMFTLNVVTFLNNNPAGVSFHFNGTTPSTGHVGVDLDVSIKHPMTDQPKFNGYDVRGVFMGNGSGTMAYNSKIKYPVKNIDQFMMPDPVDGFGGPDGYTRWFNAPEFTSPGYQGYTEGKFASKTYVPTATLNAYKYFADGLTATGDAWDFLMKTSGYGIFKSGGTNTRNYYIDFPVPNPGIKFAYAVLADWKTGGGPTHAPEAILCKAEVTEHPFYESPTSKGGNLGIDVTLINWYGLPDAIIIQSPVLTTLYTFSIDELKPISTGPNWAKFHGTVYADNVTSGAETSFSVIAVSSTYDYTSPYGIPNAAGTDPLASYFLNNPMAIDDVAPNHCPLVTGGVNGHASPTFDAVESYAVSAVDPDLDTLYYNWTILAVTTVTVEF